jgi:hypothetical protein
MGTHIPLLDILFCRSNILRLLLIVIHSSDDDLAERAAVRIQFAKDALMQNSNMTKT